jgi:1,4-dihydroxy-6-naphthoate synthase
MNQALKIGFSTCPNDTFIFDALVHQKIDTQGLRFEPTLADVEELNHLALEGSLDVIKVSYAHLPAIAGKYIALNAGGALGFNCGPMVVAKHTGVLHEMQNPRVAIPGEHTTAGFLFRRYFPRVTQKPVMLFSEIEDAVAEDKVHAGLIIHESRFTYRLKGLHCIADLGELWHEETGLPLPLGCIAAKRSFPATLLRQINLLVRESVQFALRDPEQTMGYVKSHAAAMDETVIKKHINLYVNELSVDTGSVGAQAVQLLIGAAMPPHTPVFVSNL